MTVFWLCAGVAGMAYVVLLTTALANLAIRVGALEARIEDILGHQEGDGR